jgi:hypothetical protein
MPPQEGISLFETIILVFVHGLCELLKENLLLWSPL